MIIRTLRLDEDWPSTIYMGFTGAALERDWCWVAEHEGVVVAGLLACHAHGMVILLRLAAAPDAPSYSIRSLLKQAAEESKRRGFVGFCSMVDPTTEDGRKMIGIIRASGGYQFPGPLVLVCGAFQGMEAL